MIRTQVQFSDEQIRSLKARAAREHISVSALVRRAVDTWERSEPTIAVEEEHRRAIEAAGLFASGLQDIAQRHDEYLADAYHS